MEMTDSHYHVRPQNFCRSRKIWKYKCNLSSYLYMQKDNCVVYAIINPGQIWLVVDHRMFVLISGGLGSLDESLDFRYEWFRGVDLWVWWMRFSKDVVSLSFCLVDLQHKVRQIEVSFKVLLVCSEVLTVFLSVLFAVCPEVNICTICVKNLGRIGNATCRFV